MTKLSRDEQMFTCLMGVLFLLAPYHRVLWRSEPLSWKLVAGSLAAMAVVTVGLIVFFRLRRSRKDKKAGAGRQTGK